MTLAPVLWSTAGVVARHVERAGALEMVFWRSLFAAIFVCATLFLLQRTNPVKAIRAAGSPGLFSGAMWGIMFTAFVIALSLTSVANTLIVMSTGPLLTALAARVFLSDPLPARTWVAAAAAAGGIAWMFSGGFGSHGSTDVEGMLVASVIPVTAAANVVNLRRHSGRVDLVPAVMLGGILSCIVALPFAVPLRASPSDLALLAFLGFFQLGLPCMLVVVASRKLLAPEIALIGLLEVLLGPLWTWLGAHERPADATLAGGAVVLGALLLNELTAAATLRGSSARSPR